MAAVSGRTMNTDELLDGLTDAQIEAVTHTDGPLLVLAGPGSGKTRVVTRRAAYLARTVTEPRFILAVTFTNKAAREMATRMTAFNLPFPVTCTTFHSFCAAQLRRYAERAGIQPNYTIFDMADQTAAVKEALQRTEISTENLTPGKALGRISNAKNDMISPERMAEDAEDSGQWQDQKVAAVYAAYQEVLREQNALDFDDLLVKFAQLLGNDGDARHEIQYWHRYILVDEYQDTNIAQYLIARGLALEHENLCVTGDPDQSIYGWRGANLYNILKFEDDFPEVKVVRLEQNYRSTPQILRAADALIANNTQRKIKGLYTQNEEGPPVTVVEAGNAHEEAGYVAAAIQSSMEEGGSLHEVAVFYRVNSLSRNVEAAMIDAGIPYQVARGVAFYNRKEIKDVLAYLRVVANPQDAVSFARIINTPARGLGKTTVERILAHAQRQSITPMDAIANPTAIPDIKRALKKLQTFAALMDEIRKVAETSSMQATLEFVIEHSGLAAMWHKDGDDDAAANVGELITAAAEYDRQQADDESSLTEWLTQISLISDVDAIDPEMGAVTLMTLHAAKGLEFDHVYMIGVERGLLPHERSLQNETFEGEGEGDDIEEERRLCFVGMTRARKKLTMLCAQWREVRGRSMRTTRSRFLTELPADEVEFVSFDLDGTIRRSDHVPASKPSKRSVDTRMWRQGQIVRHADYGIGRVESAYYSRGETHARIHFRDQGLVTLVLEYVDLEVVDMDELGDLDGEDAPF